MQPDAQVQLLWDDEGANANYSLKHLFINKCVNGLPNGLAGDSEMLGENSFWRQPVAWFAMLAGMPSQNLPNLSVLALTAVRVELSYDHWLW